jgi:hypothetical protein
MLVGLIMLDCLESWQSPWPQTSLTARNIALTATAPVPAATAEQKHNQHDNQNGF